MKDTKELAKVKAVMDMLEIVKENNRNYDEKGAYERMRALYDLQAFDELMIFKVKEEEYKEWYERWKDKLGTTLEQECIYIVNVHNKAFNKDALGYSIFAQSLGSMIRKEYYFNIDRIERCAIEYAYRLPKERYEKIKEILEYGTSKDVI